LSICPVDVRTIRLSKLDSFLSGFTIPGMNFPRVASHLEAAQWVYHGQGSCMTCKRRIEWWSAPGNRKRAFDAMADDRSPVIAHRCDRQGYPSPESLRRQTARW
jgi:hypothetical protein